jgi:hypothetical protein
VPALPAAVICAALALDGLAEAAVALLGRAGRPALTAAVAVVPLAAGVYDGSAYFGRYAEAYPYAEATAQANFIAGLGSNYQVFVVAAPTFDANHPNIRFLAPEADARELTNPTAQLPAPPLQKPLAVVVYQGRQDMLALLQSLYPGGELRPIEHPPGRYLNTAYLVPVESASRPWPDGQGLARELRPEQAGAPAVPHLDRAIAFRDLAALSPAPGQPFRANWRGELLAPRPGGYELELLTDGAAALRLDGRDVLQDAAQPGLARPLKGTITLEPGPHPIEIDYRWARGPGYLELRWRLPGREPSLVPPEALRAR